MHYIPFFGRWLDRAIRQATDARTMAAFLNRRYRRKQ